MDAKKDDKDIVIVYKDDDDTVKTAKVNDYNITNGFVTFLTQSQDKDKNKIFVPVSRVLKIKEKKGDDDESTTDIL